MVSPHSPHRHLITRIENLSGTVILSDHSEWHVSLADQSKLKEWWPFEEVELSPGEAHRSTLWHTRRQEAVVVERLR